MGRFKGLLDNKTAAHRWASYGITVALIIAAAFLSPGKELLDNSAGTLVILFILFYTILTSRILETLIFSTIFGIALLEGPNFIEGFRVQLFKTMAGEDFIWIVLMCCFLNVFNKFLNKTGSLHSFSKLIKSRVKSKGQLNIATWLLQFPLFFDDYMTIAVGGSIMAPMYDELDVPREEGAYLIHTLAEPLRAVVPVTSWAAFLAGCFISTGLIAEGEGIMAFIKSIPFAFYPIIAIIGTFLFAVGILPKWGFSKAPSKEYYKALENLEESHEGKKEGNLLDFFFTDTPFIRSRLLF